MRKHIFGFAVFSFIFASFAIVFAFINAPAIPKGDAVEVFGVPVYKSEKPSSCHKSAKEIKNVRYSVLSSEYFSGDETLVTVIKVDWNGDNDLPKEIAAEVSYSTAKNWRGRNFVTVKRFVNPFADSRSKIMTIVSKVKYDNGDTLNSKDNNYAIVNVSDNVRKVLESELRNDLIEPTPIVYVHGEKSKVNTSLKNLQ